MLAKYILIFLPVIAFLLILILPKRGLLKKIPFHLVMLFSTILTFAIGLYPVVPYSDKEGYVSLYLNNDIITNWIEYKDVGWVLLSLLFGKIFGERYEFLFTFVAFLYVFSTFFVAKKFFGKNYMGYYVIMTCGMLGFSGYGTNVIRSGLALSVAFLAFSFDGKKLLKILLIIASISFHKSMVIPIAAFLGANILNKNLFSYAIWVGCLVLSISNFDLSGIFEQIGVADNRVEKYTTMENSAYETGFRLDFLTYSLIPILFSFVYVINNAVDRTYNIVYRMYILANSVWLLVIRIPFSNRMAYLSWFLIPFLLLYPLLRFPRVISHAQQKIFFIMFIFLGVNLLLSLREL